MKNVVILGLGSIGQRHFRNLKKIDSKIQFFAIREKRHSPKLNRNNVVLKKTFDCSKNNIREISFNEIEKYNIDTAFITNPTSKHINTAIKLAKNNCNLFIEKPLSHNLKNVNKLKKIIVSKKLICQIGFQTRYDELLNKVKKIIKEKKYGEIINANINHCHYLPNHHKYENYKISYASNKNLGGGVLLCFSHEIDYASYLFGNPKSIIPIQCFSDKLLKIDVETSVIFNIKYKDKLSVNFNLNFLRKDLYRTCEIQFEKAYLTWDLRKNLIRVNNKNIKIIKSKNRMRDDLFIKQLKNVIKNFRKKLNLTNTIQNAIENLKIIIKIKNAFKKQKELYF